MPSDQAEYVIVGAGVAGLAAAMALRRAGHAVRVLEASARIGGRAWTTHPAALGNATFDMGASWLHAAGRNPLADLARRHGEVLIDSDAVRSTVTRLRGRSITPVEQAGFDAAETELARLTDAALAGPDTSLAAVAARGGEMPWMNAVVNWEAPVIAAADATALSLRDWHTNRLDGPNLELPGGLGDFVLRRLSGCVETNMPVTAIRWGGPRLQVDTPRGTIEAAGCIVTVSTGVLASGAITFFPALPLGVQDAIGGLPMGLLNKVAFRAAGPDRLGLPPSCGVDQWVAQPGDLAMTFIAWPHGHDHVIGFMGGSEAAALDHANAAEAIAREQWCALFGSRAGGVFQPGAVVTRWASDRWTLGSYAYARPGHAGARAVLGQPLSGGRLVFAGEATQTNGLAGTVGGAFLSGERAAAQVLAAR